MPTIKNLNELIINHIDSEETYEAMKEIGLINEDEFYIIDEDEQYALKDHDHDENYASKNHNHDGKYVSIYTYEAIPIGINQGWENVNSDGYIYVMNGTDGSCIIPDQPNPLDIRETDEIIADVVLTDSVDDNSLALEAWACITRIKYYNNGCVELYANNTYPASNFNLKLTVFRQEVE